jgi:hypothetical protein
MWWPQVTGCAVCRWVKPGITQSAPASACASSARCSACSPSSAASHLIAHPQAEIGRHLVVARARGVQPPAGAPTISFSRASTFMWMSSSAVENGTSPASISDNTVSSPSLDRCGNRYR